MGQGIQRGMVIIIITIINITIPPACGGRGHHPVAGQARLGRGQGAASQAGSAATPPGAGCVRR